MFTTRGMFRPVHFDTCSLPTSILRRNSRVFRQHSTILASPLKLSRRFIKPNAPGQSIGPYTKFTPIRNYTNNYRAGPGRSVNYAIWTVILLNSAVFAVWQYAHVSHDTKLHRKLMDYTTISWTDIKAHRYFTVITSAFSHQETGHFAFNMLALHAFGSILRWVPGIGGFHVWTICIGSALASSVCWLYYTQTRQSATRGRSGDPFTQYGFRDNRVLQVAQGASGMVMGIGAVATCLVPTAPMSLFLLPIPIPLWAVTCLYAAIDIYSLDRNDRVGHAAHLGGSVFGAIYYAAFLRRFGGILSLWRRGR